MLKEYIVDPTELPWHRGETEGRSYQCQVLLDGTDGGPEAIRFQVDPTLSMYAHMHLTSQFQLLLGGSMELPKATMKLRPVAVHYTDHNMPYGPFSVSAGHETLVLHPKQGGLTSMADRTARKQIFLGGRELSGMDKDVEWLGVPGYEGVRCKVLIPRWLGPEAVILECPPEVAINAGPAPYGRYEVVLKGSVVAGGRSLGTPGIRYVVGDDTPAPIQTGAEGGTLMLLSFDKDALEGGLTGEGIAVAAAEAMARVAGAL